MSLITETDYQSVCDSILLESYKVYLSENTDHFDSKDFFKDNVMDNHEINLREFDKCLRDLQAKEYIKITGHHRQNTEGELSIPSGFLLTEKGKIHCQQIQK